jgi:hypothetical protein
VANVNYSFLVDLSQAIGISYDLKSKVLGSTTNPNSALFNISQIGSIITTGRPIFGVYDNANSFSSISFSNNGLDINFIFSPGVVFFQTNLINLPSQSIPVKSELDTAGTKLFKFYLDYNDFNLASTVFTCTITAVSGPLIAVDQLPNVNYLNNFKSVNINNYLFGVASINSSDKLIYLTQDPSNYAFVGSTLTLIFQPVVKYITTFATSGTPPDIEIPSSGIILASASVDITGSSGSLSYACPLGVIKLFEPYPIYSSPSSFFPNIASYNAFVISVNNSIKAYSTVQNYDIESKLVNSFISYTNAISPNTIGFDQYWHSQPFVPTGIFQYGLGFDGLQKVDFDYRFKNFWYFYKGVDLIRSYAVFRGDIFGGNAYIGQSLGLFPGTSSLNSYVDFTGNSTINNGTYSYGISAVTTAGEYAPTFNADTNFFFDRKINNYLSWTSSTISNLLFFHVYKNVRQLNGFQQQRLTSPFEEELYTLNDTILSNTSSIPLGVSSSYFAFKIKNSDSTSGIIGGLGFNAFITDPTPLTGIQSCLIVSAGSNYISPYVLISGNGLGASISISTVAGGGIGSVVVTSFGSGYTYTPTLTVFDAETNSGGSGAQLQAVLSELSCGIYTGSNTQPQGTSIHNLQPIPIASISSSYLMNLPVSSGNFIGLNTNTNYWAVFNMNVPFALNANQQLKFKVSSGFSTDFATSNSLPTWNTTVSSPSQIIKLGFVDQGSTGTVTSSRGVYLTNDKAAYPSRLQIYVPNLDLSTLNYNDVGPTATIIGGQIISTAPIQNSMIISVLAENSLTGFQTTLTGNLAQGTSRGTSILLGDEADLFDTVLDVFVTPDLVTGVNFVPNTTVINWTIYDTFTIDSLP